MSVRLEDGSADASAGPWTVGKTKTVDHFGADRRMVELAHCTARPFITRPFVRLSETAEAWRLGNTEARAGLTDGQGEIGRVGIVLDAFMDELLAARVARHHLEQQRGLDRSADRGRWVPDRCCEPGPPMRPRFVLRRMGGAGAGLSAFDLAVLAAIAPVSCEELTDILGKRSFSILSLVERDLIGTGPGEAPPRRTLYVH